MTPAELLQQLDILRALPHETEWVEFKEAKSGKDFRQIGKYFSALCNEANLKNQPCGWLVFGVRDKDRAVIGSKFRPNPADLDSLKHEVARHTTAGTTFVDIHEVIHPDGRVVMLQVPPAPQGVPVAFQNHWYGRDGESLVGLSLQELETIRSERQIDDWSAEVCSDATIDDLDPRAIALARNNFREKNQNKDFAAQVDGWPVETFLDRAKLTQGGRITRTTILLVGREEAVHHLQPAVGQLTWKLEGEERAYEHFGPPFLLTTGEMYSRIRNTLQKVDVPGRLVPLEVPKYEKWVVLEALHNAIAHQDYSLQSRVIVTETRDSLTIDSAGRFFEGELVDYTLNNKTPQRYRNRFLADAMVNVNMIDTMGYGIHRMYLEQRRRFYPLPDFDFSNPDKVVVTIHGKVIDPNYTAVLMGQDDLPLETVILLDRVQKGAPVDRNEGLRLRRKKLIEGRSPRLFVAAAVAEATDEKAKYIRNRAFDDAHYKQMVVEYLKQFGKATRQDVEDLLLSKLSDVLDEEQKRNKVKNLLGSMSRGGTIRSIRSGPTSYWVLTENQQDGH